MANHQRMCQFLDIILASPAVPPHSSTDSDRGIRNTTANNNIRTALETLCNTRSAKIALSADRIETPVPYVLVGRQIRELLA
jgi:hypothetical protein